MKTHQIKKQRWLAEIFFLTVGLVAWILAETYLQLVTRFVIGGTCMVAAFYLGWRLERTFTRLARIDASLAAMFGEAALKLDAPDKLRTAFERFRAKQESWDKVGHQSVYLSDEIADQLALLSKEQKNEPNKSLPA